MTAAATIVSLLTLLLAASPLYGQREWHTWHFGQNTGITFIENGRVLGTPKPIGRSPVRQSEGTSMICHPCSGVPILSSDGTAAYDSLGNPIRDSDRMLGQISATQAALIVPHPGDANLYYVFTAPDLMSGNVADNVGNSWNLIDRASNEGSGAFVVANRRCGGRGSERLAAVVNEQGNGYWVAMMDLDTTIFYVYAVLPDGLQEVPVVSSFAFSSDRVGYMKFSPDGRYLAVASRTHKLELFDFDITTGVVSNRRVLVTDSNRQRVGAHVFYGLSFSEDSRKLYVSTSGTRTAIVQFDVSLSSVDEVIGSAAIVRQLPAESVFHWGNPLQLGPNGRLYVGARSSLHMIPEPNRPAPECGFVQNVVQFGEQVVTDGLPNIPEGGYHRAMRRILCPPPESRFDHTNACAGQSVLFTDSSYYLPSRWLWEFPGGNPDKFTGQNPPPIRYELPGVYFATLFTESDFGNSVRTDTIIVRPPPTVFAGADVEVCRGESVRLQGFTTGSRFRWSPGTAVSDSTILDPTVVLNSSDVRLVLTAWSAEGCSRSDTVAIRSVAAVAVVPGDTTLCRGDSVTMYARGGESYLWIDDTGTILGTNDTITLQPATTTRYTVISFARQCSDTAVVTVVVAEAPPLAVRMDTTICRGHTVELFAEGASRYRWMPSVGLSSDTAARPRATPTVTTTYRVFATGEYGCTIVDSVTIRVVPEMPLRISSDTAICEGGLATLRAEGAQAVRWWPVDGVEDPTSPVTRVAPLRTTTYYCESSTGLCSTVDSMTVVVLKRPTADLLPYDTVCAGQSCRLEATGGDTLRWYDGNGQLVAEGPQAVVTIDQQLRMFIVATTITGCTDTLDVVVATKDVQRRSLSIEGNRQPIVPGSRVESIVRINKPVHERILLRIRHPERAIKYEQWLGGTVLRTNRDGDTIETFLSVQSGRDSLVIGSGMSFLIADTTVQVRADVLSENACLMVSPGSQRITFQGCELPRRVIQVLDRLNVIYDPPSKGIHIQGPTNMVADIEIMDVLGRNIGQFSRVQAQSYIAVPSGLFLVRITDELGVRIVMMVSP